MLKGRARCPVWRSGPLDGGSELPKILAETFQEQRPWQALFTKSRPVVRSIAGTAIGSLVLVAGIALFSPPSAVAEVKIDAESQKVLDAFGKYYPGLKGFKVAVNIDLTIDRDGMKQSVKFEQKLAAERPNKFSYTYERPGGRRHHHLRRQGSVGVYQAAGQVRR